MESPTEDRRAFFLKSTFPVSFPSHEALTKSSAEFDEFLRKELSRNYHAAPVEFAEALSTTVGRTEASESDGFSHMSDTTSGEIRKDLVAMEIDHTPVSTSEKTMFEEGEVSHPFMDGLTSFGKPSNVANLMHTENNDLTHISTTSHLVDLFSELETVISGPRMCELLQGAWKEDPLMTLKVIFNARSIHLGKSSRKTFYRAAGWLSQHHPLTLVANLKWLSRPLIEKKAKKEGEDDIVVVKDENDPTRFDVQYGVAHGYWKDLLNMLALAVNSQFDPMSDPSSVLNSENPGIIRGKSIKKRSVPSRGRGNSRGRGAPRGRGNILRGRGSTIRGRGTYTISRGGSNVTTRGGSSAATRVGFGSTTTIDDGERSSSRDEILEGETPKKQKIDPIERRHEVRDERHEVAVDQFNTNRVYRALHLTIARLFADQLEKDLVALNGNDAKAKQSISLCGKWAPTHKHFHDKHTFIVSTIAEIMYPREDMDDILSPTDTRETYLRHAREKYRKATSALRKHLDIVERHITDNKFESIKYDRVPSVAMKNYTKLFIEKDLEGFEKYITKVAAGKANISGATLLPSTLVHKSKSLPMQNVYEYTMTPTQLVANKKGEIEAKALDGQWKTLVQRIKDSGSLDSCIAVCDVSGSMSGPVFPDKTCPMDSAIGLSLLIAEVADKPWGGNFITFSNTPEVQTISLEAPFHEKVRNLERANWAMNTNFEAVFGELILPMAIKNNLKQEDMVKRIFVFSDMQFDQASRPGNRLGHVVNSWTTSFERIKAKYAEAGYEMPELVFWNLAGGRAGYYGRGDGNPIAPKPVVTTDEGTCLVSGYSQGMLKVFLDNGLFQDEEEEDDEEEVVVTKNEDGEVTMENPPKKKAKMDPMNIVKKAIGHKAYGMLEVLD